MPNKKTKKHTPIPHTSTIIELIRRNGGAIRVSKGGVNGYLEKIARLAAEVCPSLMAEVVLNGERKKRWECVSSHTGRRTFVSVGMDNGVDPARLIELTGHSSMAQLLAYYKQTLSFSERMDRAKDTVESIYGAPPSLRVVGE